MEEGEAHLEEGALGALPPQGLGAWFVLAVLLIHLEILPLQGKREAGHPRDPILPHLGSRLGDAFVSAASFHV